MTDPTAGVWGGEDEPLPTQSTPVEVPLKASNQPARLWVTPAGLVAVSVPGSDVLELEAGWWEKAADAIREAIPYRYVEASPNWETP